MGLSNNMVSMFPKMLLNCTSIILHHNQTLLVPEDLSPDIPVLMATNPLVMMRDPQADGKRSPDCCPLVVVSVANLTRQHLLQTCLSKIRQRGAKFLIMFKVGLKKDNIGDFKTNFECFLVPENAQEDLIMLSPYDINGRAASRHLRVGYTSYLPYSSKEPFGGLDIELILILAKKLKVNCKMVHASVHPKLVEMVARGQLDMTICLAQLPHRYQYCDFSSTVTMTAFAFWTGYPKPVPSVWTIVNPFSQQVWLYSIVSSISLIVCIVLIKRISSSSSSKSFYTILTGQSKNDNMHLKTLFCTAFMGLYVLSMAFKGNLLAQLVRVEYEAPVDTFQDGLDKRMSFYTIKESLPVWLLKCSPNPVHRKVFHQGLKGGGLLDAQILSRTQLHQVVSGEAGLVINEAGTAGFRHLFRPSREILAELKLGFAYQRNLPIRTEINPVLARLTDTGIVKVLLDREFWKMSFQEREHHRNAKPEEVNIRINLSHIIGTSFIVLAGFVSSIVSLVIEQKRSHYTVQ